MNHKDLEYKVYIGDTEVLTFKAPFDVDCRVGEISLYDEYYLANTITIIIYEDIQ